MAITRAGVGDEARLLNLIGEFYEMDEHHYQESRVLAALRPLLADDRYGQVWLITDDGKPAPEAQGYAIVTWSWSLESGGLDCILDELYLRHRGRGHGAEALEEVMAAARRRVLRPCSSRRRRPTSEHNASTADRVSRSPTGPVELAGGLEPPTTRLQGLRRTVPTRLHGSGWARCGFVAPAENDGRRRRMRPELRSLRPELRADASADVVEPSPLAVDECPDTRVRCAWGRFVIEIGSG